MAKAIYALKTTYPEVSSNWLLFKGKLRLHEICCLLNNIIVSWIIMVYRISGTIGSLQWCGVVERILSRALIHCNHCPDDAGAFMALVRGTHCTGIVWQVSLQTQNLVLALQTNKEEDAVKRFVLDLFLIKTKKQTPSICLLFAGLPCTCSDIAAFKWEINEAYLAITLSVTIYK